jgi:hypothetical protein
MADRIFPYKIAAKLATPATEIIGGA